MKLKRCLFFKIVVVAKFSARERPAAAGEGDEIAPAGGVVSRGHTTVRMEAIARCFQRLLHGSVHHGISPPKVAPEEDLQIAGNSGEGEGGGR